MLEFLSYSKEAVCCWTVGIPIFSYRNGKSIHILELVEFLIIMDKENVFTHVQPVRDKMENKAGSKAGNE